MIQTQDGVDRGQALFGMFPEAITNIALRRIDQWFQSPQYSGFANNCKQMDMYVDNNAPAVSTFISDITPQTIRRGYVEYKALIKKFLETDPLFSPKQGSMLNEQQEHLITKLINDNLEKTGYRERCLEWTIDHIVRYGTAATYSYAITDYNANSLMTVKGEFEGQYEQQYGQGEPAVVSVPVHPLNVIMDPRSNFMVTPDFMGFIGDICIANLAVLLDNQSYIQKNLLEVFDACKKGLPDEHWYGDQTRHMGHVHDKISAHFVGDVAEALPIDDAGIGGEPGDNHFWLMLAGQGFNLSIVDMTRGRVQAVLVGMVNLAGKIHLRPVGQVTAVGQTHAQDRIARFDQSHIRGGIGLRAGMWLHIGIIRAEQFLGALDGEFLHHIDKFAAAVITLARIAFGILVR